MSRDLAGSHPHQALRWSRQLASFLDPCWSRHSLRSSAMHYHCLVQLRFRGCLRRFLTQTARTFQSAFMRRRRAFDTLYSHYSELSPPQRHTDFAHRQGSPRLIQAHSTVPRQSLATRSLPCLSPSATERSHHLSTGTF